MFIAPSGQNSKLKRLHAGKFVNICNSNHYQNGTVVPQTKSIAVALWGGRVNSVVLFRVLEGVNKCFNNEERIAVQDMNGVNLERCTAQGITQGVT